MDRSSRTIAAALVLATAVTVASARTVRVTVPDDPSRPRAGETPCGERHLARMRDAIDALEAEDGPLDEVAHLHHVYAVCAGLDDHH